MSAVNSSNIGDKRLDEATDAGLEGPEALAVALSKLTPQSVSQSEGREILPIITYTAHNNSTSSPTHSIRIEIAPLINIQSSDTNDMDLSSSISYNSQRRRQEISDKKHHGSQDSHRSPARDRPSPKTRRYKSTEVACHRCHRDNSPQWRTGPDGPGTLCNVCGLLYAKRKSHKRKEITLNQQSS